MSPSEVISRHALLARRTGTEVRQIGDTSTRPEMPQSAVARVGARGRDGNGCLVRATTGFPRELDRTSRVASPLAEDHNRAAGEQVRDRPRLDVVGVESVELHVDPGEHGRVDVAAEPCRCRRRFAGFRHDERFAEARPGDALDEEPVHAAADTEREEIDVVPLIADVVEHVRLRLDVAVGHQHDAAGHVRLTRDGDRPLERGQEPRPAAAVPLAR